MWKIICLAFVFGSFLPSSNAALCDSAIVKTCAANSDYYNLWVNEIIGRSTAFDTVWLSFVGTDSIEATTSSPKSLPNGDIKFSVTYSGLLYGNAGVCQTSFTRFRTDLTIMLTLHVSSDFSCTYVSLNVDGQLIIEDLLLLGTVDSVKLNADFLAYVTYHWIPAFKNQYLPPFCGCLIDKGACKVQRKNG